MNDRNYYTVPSSKRGWLETIDSLSSSSGYSYIGPAPSRMMQRPSVITYNEDTRSTTTHWSKYTQDTLRMIPTPWSTESWSSKAMTPPQHFASKTICNAVSLTSFSLKPRTTTNDTMYSLSMDSESTACTRTLLRRSSTWPTLSRQLGPRTSRKFSTVRSTDTLSSWTLEDFTSAGCISVDPPRVVAAAPGTPNNSDTYTTAYPSTLNTSTVTSCHSNISVYHQLIPSRRTRRRQMYLDRIEVRVRRGSVIVKHV